MLASRTAFAARTVTCTRSLVAFTPKRALVVQNAHKKGAGSTKNGRDSKSKRRGVKSYGGQPIKAGAIIVRQLGSTVRWGPGGQGVEGGSSPSAFLLSAPPPPRVCWPRRTIAKRACIHAHCAAVAQPSH